MEYRENSLIQGGEDPDEAMRALSDCGPDQTSGCGNFLPLEHIWNYGCWCYFGESAGSGSGPAMDELDEICRNLQYCYRCAKIDSWNNGEEICVPGSQDYNMKRNMGMGESQNGIFMDCSSENQDDDCAVHTCCCETEF